MGDGGGPLFLIGRADRQARHEEVRERADPERVGDGPDADGAAEQPAGHEHGDLDARADHPNRMSARGQAGHQAVARPGAEPRADVCAGGEAVEDHATGHQRDLERQAVRGRERHEHQVDHRPDHEDVARSSRSPDAGAAESTAASRTRRRSRPRCPRRDRNAATAPGGTRPMGPRRARPAAAFRR